MTLAEIIASCRKKLGLTQEGLAQRLGVTNQAVSKWESGQSCPDIALLPNLADIFSWSMVMPKISARLGNRAISGQLWPDSHLLTA